METTLIGATVKNKRASLGLSPSKLAAACGLEQSVIDRIESGKTKNPHDDTLQALAKALGISFDLLKGAVSAQLPSFAMVREEPAVYQPSLGVTVVYDGLDVRYQVLVNELKRCSQRLDAGPEAIIRHAGLVSSLSIPNAGHAQISSNSEAESEESRHSVLLEEERDQLIRCVEAGVTVRCLISPDTYWQRLWFHAGGFQNLSKKDTDDAIHWLAVAESRLNQLANVIKRHIEYKNLQVVFGPQLPSFNLFIFGSRHVVYGRKTSFESGYSTTVSVEGGASIQLEIDDFDRQCQAAAVQIAGGTMPFLNRPQSYVQQNILGSYALKQKVLDELARQRDRLGKCADGLKSTNDPDDLPFILTDLFGAYPQYEELWLTAKRQLDKSAQGAVIKLLYEVVSELMRRQLQQYSPDAQKRIYDVRRVEAGQSRIDIAEE
jgi:transcriptional regulator with XRE-family HTH domain